MSNYILKNALISEKSFAKAGLGKFTFIVAKSASKEEIEAAVKSIYDVDIVSINTINVKGKVKRTKKGTGKRQDFKKAILTLKKNQKIDLFEVEDEKKEKGKAESKVAKEKSEKTIVKDDSNTTVKVREKKKS